jgi:hypothetical protein
MASFMYTEAKEAILDGAIDFNTDTIRVRAVSDSDYTASAAHTAMTSVTKYSGSTDVAVDTPTITDGIFDATDDPDAFPSLAIDGSKTVDALVVFKFVTDDAGSTPILYIDLAASVTPNGGDIGITWDSGANKIFALNTV